jgi:hypothetical protein
MIAAVATAISNAPRGETAVLKSAFLADDTIVIDASKLAMPGCGDTISALQNKSRFCVSSV